MLYFSIPTLSMSCVLTDSMRMEPAAFVDLWRSVPDAEEQQAELPVIVGTVEAIKTALQSSGWMVLAHKNVELEEILYVTGRAIMPGGAVQLLLELRFSLGAPGIRAFFRGSMPQLAPLVFAALHEML